MTGRIRRCGWLDLVALRYAARLNGFTSLALTKLDVLSAFEELPVCVRYLLPDGTETEEFPAHQSDFHKARPVYDVLPGWQEPLDGIDERSRLPENARRYVEFVERDLGLEAGIIGTGAERDPLVARLAEEAPGLCQRLAVEPRQRLRRTEAAARPTDEQDARQSAIRHGSE